jgi:hypothetical protein
MDKTFNKILKEFVELGSSSLSYEPELKARFHHLGKLVAARVATELGLPKGSYDIRSNPAGMAVSGEITLHGERIYIQFSQSSLNSDLDILYRSCDGRKDYTGGSNNFLTYSELANFDEAIEALARPMTTIYEVATLSDQPQECPECGKRMVLRRNSLQSCPSCGRWYKVIA